MYKAILAVDPSGAYHEGSGNTGLCLFNTEKNIAMWVDTISAADFICMEEYWDAHLIYIEDIIRYYHFAKGELIVVIEDYLLYSNKTDTQINSRMETPKLIGILQHHLWKIQVPYYMQTASTVKKRWTEEVLVHKGYLKTQGRSWILGTTREETNRHNRDALRHAVHYATFRNED